MVADIALAPLQNIEVIRSHLIPSQTYDLSSVRNLKLSLFSIDKGQQIFETLDDNSETPFFYANVEAKLEP